MTASRQRSAVSDEAALGLLMSGKTTIPSEALTHRSSNRGRLARLVGQGNVPQVDTDLRRGIDGTIAMTRANERPADIPNTPDTASAQLLIRLRQSWPTTLPDDMADGINGGLAASAWRESAEEFLGHFDL